MKEIRSTIDFSIDKAKDLLDSGIAEAKELIKEPSKANDVLIQLETIMKAIPASGEDLMSTIHPERRLAKAVRGSSEK